MRDRYGLAGRLYDVVSLEPVLYRRPRTRLLELLGPLPGATVVDIGCGTGLNVAGLRRLVGSGGTVVGIDASASMLDGAPACAAGWPDVVIVEADANDVAGALRTAGVDSGAVRAVVATFVLSLLPDDAPVWRAVDALASRQPLRVGVADLGPPDDALAPLRPVFRALTALGGGDPARQPWEQLLARSADAVHELCHGGHVHLAVGDIDHPG